MEPGAGCVHVIGAGLAGLAAAVSLAGAGVPVIVHEAAGHAGGRCRSFYEAGLGCRIDNGNHLLLSGNSAASAYLHTIGAGGALTGPARAAFPFVDLATGERWTVAPNAGRIPWWIFSPSRRIPGTRPREYLSALRLARASDTETVRDCVGDDGALFRRFWEPLTLAALNTSPEDGAALLLWAVVRETFFRGEPHCRPRIARDCLAAAFVDPALRYLADRDNCVRLRKRVREIGYQDGRAVGLSFADGEAIRLSGSESVVVAVPPAQAADLVPGIVTPLGSRAIVNVHFRVAQGQRASPVIGVINGLCHWIFVRDGMASVTVSAADALAERPNVDIARRTWAEVSRILTGAAGPDAPLPAHRIIKEKRATFAQTPSNLARRPGPMTRWRNLFLAGDWTATALPATIEGSIRSGNTAAQAVSHARQMLDRTSPSDATSAIGASEETNRGADKRCARRS